MGRWIRYSKGDSDNHFHMNNHNGSETDQKRVRTALSQGVGKRGLLIVVSTHNNKYDSFVLHRDFNGFVTVIVIHIDGRDWLLHQLEVGIPDRVADLVLAPHSSLE